MPEFMEHLEDDLCFKQLMKQLNKKKYLTENQIKPNFVKKTISILYPFKRH